MDNIADMYINGKSIKTIAKILNISQAEVRAALEHAELI